MLQAWFHRLHSVFTQRRVNWLTKLIREKLLGSLPDDIKNAAELERSAEYQSLTEIMQLLDQQVQGISAAMPQAQHAATDEVQPASPSEDHDVPADQQAADRVEDQA